MLKKGFTLVELSIVLIIVGLLIGGILAAGSMQNTAKITTQISEWQQLATASNNYKTKYGFIPGDDPNSLTRSGVTNCSAYTGCLTTGDGDGYLFSNGAATYVEVCLFWESIKNVEKFPGTYGCHNGTLTLGVDYPAFMKSKDTYYFAMAKCATSSCAANNGDGNAIYIHLNPYPGNGNYYSPNWPNQPTTTITAAAFDAKLDDGAPLTGNVTAMNGWVIPTVGSNCVTAGSTYNTSYTSKACGLAVKLDSY